MSRGRSSNGASSLEIVHDALEAAAQALARAGVVGAVGRLGGRLLVLDVLRRDGRPQEDEIVVEVRAVQDARAHRVEEGLGALGLVMVGQQADEVQLDLAPDFVVDVLGVVLVFQDDRRLAHTLVVVGDAVALQLLQALPVAGLEQRLGPHAHLAEQAVVLVEAVEHRAGDVEGDLRREKLGKMGHGVRARAGRGPQWVDCMGFAVLHRHLIRFAYGGHATRHMVSAYSSRPISMRRISDVPAPISYSLASRHSRPVGNSLM